MGGVLIIHFVFAGCRHTASTVWRLWLGRNVISLATLSIHVPRRRRRDPGTPSPHRAPDDGHTDAANGPPHTAIPPFIPQVQPAKSAILRRLYSLTAGSQIRDCSPALAVKVDSASVADASVSGAAVPELFRAGSLILQ